MQKILNEEYFLEADIAVILNRSILNSRNKLLYSNNKIYLYKD